MFGAANPYGQPSNQSVFGQNNSATNNPFAPKPFGSTSPFGSQTGGSMFGGTSTGVFGVAQSASSLGSTPFGSSSSPAFGSSFGAASTPTFGNSSSSFGGFGQKPAFGGFGSTATQSSPFGSILQQSQPASGSNPFGSSTTPFGASNQPTFGATNTAFGSTNTPAFGAPSSPAFGATTTNAFGATTAPSFGGTGGAFGGASAFGTGGAFGGSGTSPFGAASTPAFGANTSAFSASSSPAFNFGSTPDSSPFGTTGSSFGAQSSPFGTQSTTPAFASTGFGQSRGGSRVAPYTPTTDADGASGTQSAGKIESISAMPVYKEKSHEELRWEDYQLGDKGGPNAAGQSTNGYGLGMSTAQTNAFTSSSPFGPSSSNPFSSTTASSPFAPSNTGASSTPAFNTSLFSASTPSNPFGQSSSSAPSVFATSTSPFASNPTPSIFATPSSTGFGSSPSIFGSTPAQGSTPAFNGFNIGGTQSSPLFQSTAPSSGQTSSPFGQNSSAFGQTTSVFGQQPSGFGQQTSGFGQQTSSAFGQNPAPPQSNPFSTPSTGFTGFTSTPFPSSNTSGFGLTTSSISTPFQSAQPAQTSNFNFVNIGQTQAAATGGGGGSLGSFGHSPFGQMPTSQSTMVSQPAPMANPYGVLPVMPQMSIDRDRNSPSIQYGISSMPVIEKSAPVRISSLFTSRHISQRRMKLPARNYHPKQDGQRVAFFNDDEETSSTPKADALFIPRENPRSLVIRPKEQWSSRAIAEKASQIQETAKPPVYENGKNNGILLNGSNGEYKGSNGEYKGKNKVENGMFEEPNHSSKLIGKSNGVHGDRSVENGGSSILNGQRSGKARADIDSLMPKLQRSDYFTGPRIEELAAKERVEPGFCQHVKNFVIGRHGYGSIIFLGETDVQGLDLESLVQFNNREVIVYMDESKKPPVGEGLNKPAEVTLLNIKCVDKKAGTHYTEGPKIDKYKEMLKKKADDQGAEFVSYDPVQGEWKFRVSHF